MVAINEILLRECTGEGWGGGTQICTDSRVHRRNADWSTPPAGTQPLVNNLYQGMALDAVTGLYYERFRNYSPTLGRWTSRDPLGYIDGANTYQFVDSSPVGNVDAGGASLWTALGGALGGFESQLGMLAEEALSAYNRAITALMLESLPPCLRTLPISKIPPLPHSPYHGLTFMKSETKGNFGPAGGSVGGGVSVPIGDTPFSVLGLRWRKAYHRTELSRRTRACLACLCRTERAAARGPNGYCHGVAGLHDRFGPPLRW